MSYGFRPDIYISDVSYKHRLDDLVEARRNILVVGWNQKTGYGLFQYLNQFAHTTLVELVPDNVKDFTYSHPRLRGVACCDIRCFDLNGYDCVIWQHGPEYMSTYKDGVISHTDERTDKYTSADVIKKMQAMIPFGVIEAYNCSNYDYDSYKKIQKEITNQWWGHDFTALLLEWRHYGESRGATDNVIGYWEP